MWRTITHTLRGPGRVDADIGGVVLRTDHPPEDERADRPPPPWHLFLASIGTCAGAFVAGYCDEHGLPCEGIRIVQRQDFEPDRDEIRTIELTLELPVGFPDAHRKGVVAAANDCLVKRVIESGPEVRITAPMPC